MEMSNNKNWSGTSMEDLYEMNDPYSFAITPVVPSRHHAVLYELPATLATPPIPHQSTQTHHWDRNYAKLPYAPQNMFPVKNEHGEEELTSRWQIIETTLLQPISSSRELETAINCYNSHLPSFLALHYLFEEVLDEEESQIFFTDILPGIIRLALQLPEILPGNLPLLQKESCCSITLSQLQIASLLANSFLCTFPWRKDVSNTYPGVNFSRLFAAHHRPKRLNCVVEKIKAICHYFRRVLAKTPIGTVTFERKFLLKNQFPRWDRLDNNLANTRIHICSTGTIENNGHGLLQVDFANKFVGGGVLGYGCVQEEIRYIICPELIISRLFTEELGHSETLVITGVERYSNYSGYGDTFNWEGDYRDQTPHDCYGRRKTSIVAIDAIKFNKSTDQFGTSQILRELNKAYVGFHTNLNGKLAPVATGNWGCGAFKGDPRLKSLIQLMACSAAKRNMVYYTFGDTDLEKTIYDMHTFLVNHKVVICELWRILCRFVVSKANQNNLIPYIQQAYFDLHNQPPISHFFSESNANTSNKTEPSLSARSAFKPSGTWPIKYIRTSANRRDSIPTTSSSTADFSTQDASREKVTTEESTNIGGLFAHDVQDRLAGENVIDLIKIIDGDVSDKKQENRTETTLLSSIDKYCGRNRTERNVHGDSVCIDVEMDDIPIERHKIGPKRTKISDYYVKVTK